MTKMKDSEILQAVLDGLGIKAHSMANTLGFNSPSSIYHILNGKNAISEGMVDKIIKAYPNVNYLFLTNAELPVILDATGAKNQMNMFNLLPMETREYNLFKRFMDLPKQLDRIEEKLDQLLGNENGD